MRKNKRHLRRIKVRKRLKQERTREHNRYMFLNHYGYTATLVRELVKEGGTIVPVKRPDKYKHAYARKLELEKETENDKTA